MAQKNIPFHKAYFDTEEIKEVSDSLVSGWWTMGPKTKEFEKQFSEYLGAKYCVSSNSWTSSAHLVLEAMGISEGDEVIVPSVTFTATAEIVCYFKAKPVIVDIERETGNIQVNAIEKAISKRTKAIIPVHYGGQPCDMDEIAELASHHNIRILEDAAHSLPSYYKGKKIGSFGDVVCFSFYATKTLATGEGGMICTSDEEIAKRATIMRLHGMSRDAWNRYTAQGSWFYEIVAPGFKYNMTDINAALGLAQLKKLDSMNSLRKTIAQKYIQAFNESNLLTLPLQKSDRETCWHLFPILLNLEAINIDRSRFINEMKDAGIVCSVHFIPLYRHPYYKTTFGLDAKDFANSEFFYEREVSLPIWPGMSDEDIDFVADTTLSILERAKK